MKPITQHTATVQSIEYYNKFIFSVKINAPQIAENARPGHFVMIRDLQWQSDPLLNRPMSIASVDLDSGTLELQILITGRGTRLLSSIKTGDKIIVIGPLGSVFSKPNNAEEVILVAGGIGVAPLIFFDRYFKPEGRKFIYGAAGKNALIPGKFIPANIEYCTDDGSFGHHGFVTSLLQTYLNPEKPQRIYACGPTPMLVAVQKIMKKNNIPGEISIETMMACGFGLCLGCVVPKAENPQEYYLACKEGPVFNANEIVLE